MLRRLTTAQFNNARATATRPVRLVRWELSGALELLSGSGDIEFDGELYAAGGFDTVTVNDGRSAVITLPATRERVQQVLSGNWRNGKLCQIYTVPGLPEDDGVYTLEQGMLELDGVIDFPASANGTITVNAIHRLLRSNLTPRTTFNEFSLHIPPAGTIVEHEGDKYTLVSRR